MKVTRRIRKVGASSETDVISSWEDLDFYEQIEVMKKFVRDYKGTKVFEDFAHKIGVDVEDIIDTFCDAEAHGDIKIPWKKQKDSEYANDDIYGSIREELDTVYVESSTAVEGTMLPGPGDYDPPEYDEPVELDEATDYINVQLDADIVIDADGSWEYVDDTYSWACPDEKTDDWYSDESGVYLDDCVGVVEKVDDLMADLLPNEPGTYHVSGNVNLYYSTTGLAEYRDYYTDEDGHLCYDSIPANDYADVHYVKEESTLDDFRCVPS